MEIINSVFALLGLLGIGSIIGAFLNHMLQFTKLQKEQQLNLKFTRYKAIILFMIAKLKPEQFDTLKEIRPDITNELTLDKQLQMEKYNLLLYSSNDVINTTTKFMETPSSIHLINVIEAMRKDLWNKKSKLLLQNEENFFI